MAKTLPSDEKQVKADYRAYVESFQRFRNPPFTDWVRENIELGHLLWRAPLVQISRRYKPGKPLQEMVDESQGARHLAR